MGAPDLSPLGVILFLLWLIALYLILKYAPIYTPPLLKLLPKSPLSSPADKYSRYESSISSLTQEVKGIRGDFELLDLQMKTAQDILVENQKINKALERLLLMINSRPPTVAQPSRGMQSCALPSSQKKFLLM
ncbi:unnamed protein product [Clonostachys rosea]|uniref:Uncharacterized protein n=1 Tax=Bionectria ochroleuca TaxID=29856 RepID=A0ABY6UFN6_BIOOC|nr:unnamed protein product [Clonostachys rosea]